MALGDREHVEAVAIMRRLKEMCEGVGLRGEEGVVAAEVWLKANHPSPEIYMAALGGG